MLIFLNIIAFVLLAKLQTQQQPPGKLQQATSQLLFGFKSAMLRAQLVCHPLNYNIIAAKTLGIQLDADDREGHSGPVSSLKRIRLQLFHI